MPDVRIQGQERDAGSRGAILDVAERLMATRGYAATSISAICRDSGLPPPSVYWHFGSKKGLLAAVMERGARRWFAGMPSWDDLAGEPGERVTALLAAGADALAGHPLFLRLFYMLALDGDEAAAELVRQVRSTAFERFRDGVARVLAADHPPEVVASAAEELARFAVAFSDGCFFALQLEPGEADVRRMFADLGTALLALAPIVIARAAEPGRKEGPE
ncbi:TetR/AcrR family transcriptional regulator [Actinocorallia longicatena]|uniref:TetR/AcrR family transcriptional regulator n=1 Tax=Actinocorallia longicatena TaxID=111803 RepID=A0ABP6QHH4_9ACTN